MKNIITDSMIRLSLLGGIGGTVVGAIIGLLMGILGIIEVHTVGGGVYVSHNAMKGVSLGMALGFPLGVALGTALALIKQFLGKNKDNEPKE